MTSNKRRLAILAEGRFNIHFAKTAVGAIRYSPHDVVAVIDSENAGKTVQEVLGFGGDIPVVASVEDSKKFDPDVMVIGIAPAGGRLPTEWRPVLNEAIDAHMDIWSGLHFFLANDPELAELAALKGVKIWDVRRPRPNLDVASGKCLDSKAFIVLAVGSDCNVGKMTVTLELQKYCNEHGYKAGFVATGQTGILIEGEGTPLDAVPGDFMPGEVERLVVNLDEKGCDVIFVEGQGAIIHPAYGAVTLGLMLGAMPDAYILCHQPGRTSFRPFADRPIPSLTEMTHYYEDLMKNYKAPKVACVALNTFGMTPEVAQEHYKSVSEELSVPAVDPIRDGVEVLWNALEPLAKKKLGR